MSVGTLSSSRWTTPRWYASLRFSCPPVKWMLSGNPSDGLVSLSLVKLCGTQSVRSYVPMVPSKVSMVVPGPTVHHAGRAGEIE